MFIDNTTKTAHFDSVAEMARYAQSNRCTYDASGTGWYGGKTREQTLDACISGDDSVVDEARRMMDRFAESIEINTPTLMPEVAGAFPLVPAYLGGDPECFLTVGQQPSASSPLTILVDTTCSASIKASEMRKRGTAILAVVMALAATRPIRLELFSVLDSGYEHARDDGSRICFMRTVINSSPLDLATAAFALSDVSCARRVAYGIVRHAFQSPLQWPFIKGVDAQQTRDPKVMQATLQHAGIEGDVLYMPAAHAYDPAIVNPEGFVRKTFDQFRGDLAARH